MLKKIIGFWVFVFISLGGGGGVTPVWALTPEQIAQQQLVIQQQQEQALQNERNQQQVLEAQRVRESRDQSTQSDKSN